MRTKTVRIDKTRHKTQPYTVTELGKVDKVRAERYKTERTASVGAVRACRDWFSDGTPTDMVRILLPNGRERRGYIGIYGKVKLLSITETRIPLRKSSTKAKK